MLLWRATLLIVVGIAPVVHAQAVCSDKGVKIGDPLASDWNGWSPALTNTRFQSADAAGLTVAQVQKLKLKWAFGFEGDTMVFAQSSVIGNNLFLGSVSGKMHALDARSGCTRWTFQAESAVRPSIVMVPAGAVHALLFGDRGGTFYSLEAETGRVLWKKKVDDHAGARVTGSAVVHEGVIYIPVASSEETLARRDQYACCTFRESVVALRVEDGSQMWKTYMIPEPARKIGEEWGPSGAGVWSAPTLDVKRGRLYVGTGNNYSEPATATSDAIVALELKTGRMVWTRQTRPGDILNGNCQSKNTCPGPDYDYGASPILEKLGGGRELLLVGQKSGIVYALDPDKDGQIVWEARVGKGGVNDGVQWGMASDGRNLYAAPPPCGDKMGCSPAQSAAVSVIPGVVFSGSLDGHLRAFSTEDGKVLWDFDTVRDFATVNGVKASGGGIDGPGAIVSGGTVYVGSGYQRTRGMGGNVLLAFGSVE